MVVGDSWALFSWTFDSYNENLDRYGFTDVRANSSITISIAGARAENFFSEPSRKQGVADFLAANPDVEFCHLSLGGNDALGEWNKFMTPIEVDSLLSVLMDNIKSDMDTILSLSPDITFVISGYDYPNFVETAALSSIHPYYGQWTDMGQPDAFEINTMLQNLTQRLIDSSAVWDHVYFVDNTGLMQWTYGQTSPMIVPPYSTYPAHSVMLPGGDMNYPSPRTAMGLSGTDSFHLSDASFETFIQRHFEEYYWDALRNADTSIIAYDTTLNGYLSSTTYSIENIKTGKIGNDDIQSILTFNTSAINPLFEIQKASIFLNRQNLSGNNLIGQDLTLEIKSGYYGANLQIENDDFSCAGDTSFIACTYGTVEDNDYWMRIDIPEALVGFINKNGYTQFKLKYLSAATDNYFEFKNSNDTSAQPILDINYDFSSTTDKYSANSKFKIFPNPANDFLNYEIDNFSNNKQADFEIIDFTGKIVFKGACQTRKNRIDISNLPAGIYLFKFVSDDYSCSSKLIITR